MISTTLGDKFQIDFESSIMPFTTRGYHKFSLPTIILKLGFMALFVSVVDKNTSTIMFYRSCLRPTAPQGIMLPNGAYLQGSNRDEHPSAMVAGCFMYYSDAVSLGSLAVGSGMAVANKNIR